MERTISFLRLGLSVLVFISFFVLGTSTVFAAPRTWTGATSTDWATASNWGGTLPSGGDTINIPGSLTNYPVISTTVTGLTGSVNINSAGSGATLTVTSGGTLSLAGTLKTSSSGTGSLIVSGGTVSMSNDRITNNGTFTFSSGTVTVKDFDGSGTTSMSGGTFQVDHDFKPATPSNFSASGGTVEFTDSNGGAGFGVNSGTYTFYDALFSGGTQTINGNSSTKIVVTNDLSFTGGKLGLTSTTNTANALYLASVQQVAGTWGSASSSASNPNNTYFSGSGIVTVATSIKTDPTLSVTNSPQTYSGSAQSASVSGSVAGTVSNVKYDGSATVPTNAGTYAVTADFAPTDTSTYNSLTGASAGNFVINKTNSTTTVSCPSSVVYNGSAQTPCSVTVTGAGGLSLTPTPNYTGNTNVGTASASYTYTGDSNYNGSDDSKNFDITKVDAVIAVTPYSVTYDGDPHTATGTATGVLDESLSGLDLSTTTHTNANDYSADGWTFTDVTGNYNNASGTVHDVINKADQTIDFNIASHTFGDPDFGISATSTSGGSVSFSLVSGDCTLDTDTVHITGAGDCTIRASQAGDDNYNAAPDVDRTFNIAKSDQTIDFGSLPTKIYGDADFDVSATASSGLEVSFVASGDCTISGLAVHITGAGNCSVTASQVGDSNYNSASDVEQSFSIQKADQTINFGSLLDKTFGDADFDVSATATSGLGVTFTASGGCSVSGNTVHITGAGDCTVTAHQEGNNNYNAAPDVGQSFEIAKGAQLIDFGSLVDKTVGDPDFDLSATATSGLGVTFSLGEDDSGVCSLSEDLVHIIGLGTCTVVAHQSGNDNYNGAPDVQQSFTVAALVHTITVSSGANGLISPPGDDAHNVTVADGEDQSFTITANDGFHTVDVIIDTETHLGAVGDHTFSHVTTNHTISATFEANPPTGPTGGSPLSGGGGGLTTPPSGNTGTTGTSGTSGTSTGSSGTIPSSGGTPPPTGQVLGAQKFVFTLDLKKGPPYHLSTWGNEVTELQKLLADLYIGPIDGKFGVLTEAAVKAFQKAHPPLNVDGVVGADTRAVLNSL